MLAADPCWRREKGGWHLSAGHCNEMLAPQRLTGVWVRGFEESSFFPGDSAIPDRNDDRRFRITLEADWDQVATLAGSKADGPDHRAFRLTFRGRRTRWPVAIDCYGRRHYVFILDDLESAAYVGIMRSPDWPSPSKPSAYQPFKRSGEGGRLAELEEQALASCS